MQFAKRDPNILLAQIVGPMTGVGLFMVVIVIVCWMKRTRRGPWKKRVLSEPHVRYQAGEIVQIGTDQDGTAIYRMNNNHNQNRELIHQKLRQSGHPVRFSSRMSFFLEFEFQASACG